MKAPLLASTALLILCASPHAAELRIRSPVPLPAAVAPAAARPQVAARAGEPVGREAATRTVSFITFVRGDANGDGTVDMSDALNILNCQFAGQRCSTCDSAADVNDDDSVDLTDALSALNFLYRGAARPPLPYPTCGVDLTPKALDCRRYASCDPVTMEIEEGTSTSIFAAKAEPGEITEASPRKARTIPTRTIGPKGAAPEIAEDMPSGMRFIPEFVYLSGRRIMVKRADGSGNVVTGLEITDKEMYPRLHPYQSKVLYHDRQKGYSDKDIFVINADGSGKTQLTHDHDSNEQFPTWSPDGQWIAFTKGEGWQAGDGVFLMRHDGSDLFKLTTYDFAFCSYLTWSPDGSRIACIGSIREADGKLGHEELFLVDVASGWTKRITHTYGQDLRHFQPAWHPSGDALAFSRGWKDFGQPAQYDIYMVLVNGMGVFPFPMQLTRHSARDISPSFSPDGDHLVFTSQRQVAADNSDIVIDQFNLFTMHISGGEWEQMTYNGACNAHWR